MSRKMRDSGVEWIGAIPEGWEMSPLKRLVSCNDEVLPETTPTEYLFDYIDVGSVKYGKGIVGTERMQFSDSPSRARRIVRKDDVIVSTVRTYLKSVANIPDSEIPLIASTGFAALRSVAVNPGFLKYLVQADSFVCEVESKSVGISYPAINASELIRIKVPTPPRNEQQEIANFLDTQCVEIDAAIASARQSIEDYKALKKSLVFEAVTGKREVEKEGGGGGRPMRDSGVPWIGAVPEGWELCKVLHVLDMPITDGPHTTPDLFDEGVPFVSAEAVSCGNGSIDFGHIRGYISEDFYQECCKKYIPRRDDIYMIKSGATTGRVSIVDTDQKFTIWSPLAVFRPDRNRVVPKYLYYYLQSPCYQTEVELGWSYGTQQNIGMRALEALPVLRPSLPEQRAIADYLDEKCGAIDALVAEKEALITDLEAYKKSLIFEVVTGKRPVGEGSSLRRGKEVA